jgi:hypothetical protein
MFNIFDLESGQLIELGDEGAHLIFETGQLAAAYCKQAKAEGRKLQPRPAAKGDDNWQRRERERCANGTYKRPDYLVRLERDIDHFLHLAEKKPGQLAYTKDAAKGAQDLQSIISLQGYIEAFASDMLPEHLEEIKAEHEGQSLNDDDLKFAKTPAEITRVYTHYDRACSAVSNSCMRYDFDDGDDAAPCPKHPCSVYGAGDLAVAYTANDEGRTTARALCWPDKKLYSRVYANDGDKLHRLLKARGYRKSAGYYGDQDHEQSLEGARLLKITCEDDSDVYLVPYCDDISNARRDDKFLVLDPDGGIDLRRTDGWSDPTRSEESEYEYTCDRCEEGCDETNEVHTSRNRSQYWCNYCSENDAFYCDHINERYSDSVESVQVGDETWSIYAFEDDGGECQRTQGNHADDDLEDVIVDEDGTTERWGPRARDRYTWRCERSNELVADDVEPAKVIDYYGNMQDWAPHIAALHARDHALVVVKPVRPRKLSLTGDHPGQMPLPIYLPYLPLAA